MKAGWEVKTLGEVYDVRDGTHDSPKYVESGYPLITSKNLKDKGLSFENVQYITEADYNKINARSAVHKGDVLFAMIGTIGNPTIVEVEPNFAIKNVALLKVPQVQNSSFLKYYLETEEVISKMVSEAKGTTQKFVGLGYLRNFPIKIPSLSEQQRIVAILDQAFEGIAKARANAEQNLQNARALFESYLQSVFSVRGIAWESVTLGALLERGWIEGHLDGNHGGDYPRKEEFISEGVPYISANCLDGDQIDMTRAKYLSESHAAKLKKGIAKDNDVLFAHNATVGPVAILRTEQEKVILGTSLTYYRCNQKYILPDYMAHYMRSFEFKQQYLQVMQQSTRNQIPITKQREFFHIIPPLDEQKKVISVLDFLWENAQRLEALYQRKVACLDELKKSLLQQAFAGEL